MIPAVFDASVVIAGWGWTSEPYQCLVLTARRRIRSFVTEEIVEEWRSTLRKLEAKGTKFRRSPWPTLEGVIELSRYVTPAPLGKQRSRDYKDDPYIACDRIDPYFHGKSFRILRRPHQDLPKWNIKSGYHGKCRQHDQHSGKVF